MTNTMLPSQKFPLPKTLPLVTLLLLFGLFACTPRVVVEAPSEPITVNLNIKIDHEVRVKVEKELDDVLSDDSELF